jgi:NAD(P)-dependent dehydrogenase (short-subunit alcohol dehydrogenase family)
LQPWGEGGDDRYQIPSVSWQAERLAKAGHAVRGYVLDITDQKAVMACFEDIASPLGDVFALANVAGAVDQQPFEEITPERLDKMNRINVNGTIWCAQGALKTMKKYKDGRIINFASKSGKTGSAIMAAYSGAKGAIISITHAMAFEFCEGQHQGELPLPRHRREDGGLGLGEQGLRGEPQDGGGGGGETVHLQGPPREVCAGSTTWWHS